MILNKIYSAFLLYHLFLSCYIFKYVIIKDGEWSRYEESPLTRNPVPGPASIYAWMGMVLGTGTVKQSSPHVVIIPMFTYKSDTLIIPHNLTRHPHRSTSFYFILLKLKLKEKRERQIVPQSLKTSTLFNPRKNNFLASNSRPRAKKNHDLLCLISL